MQIIPAARIHAEAISRNMIEDLKDPDPRFPPELIRRFREHAKYGVVKEFDNKDLVAFVAMEGGLIGFLVGYREGDKVVIHYVQGGRETKRALISHCVDFCREEGFRSIEADTFECMENNSLFQEAGMRLSRKEAVADDLDMLWYTLTLVD